MKIVKAVLLILFLCTPLLVFPQVVQLSENFNSSSLYGWSKVSGNWKVIDGRLVQTDTKEKMAMITVPVKQSGTMLYEFDIRYVKGAEDNYAGFGIHICVNNPTDKRSWGNGQSILGWLTWDPVHYGSPGMFIQVYESRGKTSMGLYPGLFPSSNPLVSGDLYPVREEYLKYEYLSYTIPIRILLDTRTGKGKFYDPMNPTTYYYRFDLGAPIKPGDYFTFRTNSVSVSIDNVKITKLD